MKKKTIAGLIAIVAVVAVVMFVGCIEEKIPTSIPTETPRATPSPAITPVPTPTPQINEERDLVIQWFKMHIEPEELEDVEEGLDEFMDQLQTWDIHPVEIYRGSLIFYAKSYGYIHFPEMDEERLQRLLPDFGEPEYKNLVLEKGGTISVVFDRTMCGCFPTLSSAEDFLAELWSFRMTSVISPQIKENFENAKKQLLLAGSLIDEAEHLANKDMALQKSNEASIYLTSAMQYVVDMQKYAKTDDEKRLSSDLYYFTHYVILFNDAVISHLQGHKVDAKVFDRYEDQAIYYGDKVEEDCKKLGLEWID